MTSRLVAVLLFIAGAAHAGDPAQRWRTIDTEHFQIHYYTLPDGRGLEKVAALHPALAPQIRVNAVAPGILEPPGAPETLKQRVPAERFGTLAEVVETVVFLLAGSPYTTGEVVRVDGGRGLA